MRTEAVLNMQGRFGVSYALFKGLILATHPCFFSPSLFFVLEHQGVALRLVMPRGRGTGRKASTGRTETGNQPPVNGLQDKGSLYLFFDSDIF